MNYKILLALIFIYKLRSLNFYQKEGVSDNSLWQCIKLWKTGFEAATFLVWKK